MQCADAGCCCSGLQGNAAKQTVRLAFEKIRGLQLELEDKIKVGAPPASAVAAAANCKVYQPCWQMLLMQMQSFEIATEGVFFVCFLPPLRSGATCRTSSRWRRSWTHSRTSLLSCRLSWRRRRLSWQR